MDEVAGEQVYHHNLIIGSSVNVAHPRAEVSTGDAGGHRGTPSRLCPSHPGASVAISRWK